MGIQYMGFMLFIVPSWKIIQYVRIRLTLVLYGTMYKIKSPSFLWVLGLTGVEVETIHLSRQPKYTQHKQVRVDRKMDICRFTNPKTWGGITVKPNVQLHPSKWMDQRKEWMRETEIKWQRGWHGDKVNKQTVRDRKTDKQDKRRIDLPWWFVGQASRWMDGNRWKQRQTGQHSVRETNRRWHPDTSGPAQHQTVFC